VSVAGGVRADFLREELVAPEAHQCRHIAFLQACAAIAARPLIQLRRSSLSFAKPAHPSPARGKGGMDYWIEALVRWRKSSEPAGRLRRRRRFPSARMACSPRRTRSQPPDLRRAAPTPQPARPPEEADLDRAKRVLADQSQSTFDMPPMTRPGELSRFLSMEAHLRQGQPLEGYDDLSPYWRDLIDALRVFKALRTRGESDASQMIAGSRYARLMIADVKRSA
jgi:hypothetical protein